MQLHKNLKTKSARKFWANVKKCRRKVEQWPEWKKNIKLTKYSEEK